ncbi:ATP-binding protein [Leeuwenhoekiella parthenopeia]|uniref:ATP-binding protein n=1 Tax=Leeuwenhoekiella parthenopeia TaxID=2890320 RepID=A0ABS8GN73_9FLAO|nr:ATP-binding protein [Leeuwenhoekiella parthenopeia]MCC4211370.1 ATP-binding protein [Leeuwenhoekiella parthenopeia]
MSMNKATEEVLEMKFDPNTIEHLGVKMYSTLPPIIAEIVSNSYDAEAKKVQIFLRDKAAKKSISIEDDGHGMTFKEINTNFLRIGRNRRVDTQSQKSKNDLRFVIGKKGIGKLSFFGISDRIEVVTIANGLENKFILDWNKIKGLGSSEENYKPEIIHQDKEVDKGDGTLITLHNINRVTQFDPESIAYSLAKSFQVFDENEFDVVIYHNDKANKTEVQNGLIYSNIHELKSWVFPFHKDRNPKDYYCEDLITGKIILSKETVPHNMRGISLFSRNKLVNEYEFYDLTATSHGYSYLTGWLNVDYIDLFDQDVISTNRRSLNWETDETKQLRRYLASVISKIYNESKKIKEEFKIKDFEKQSGVSIDSWVEKLPSLERTLARKMVTSIINSEGIDKSKSTELVKFVKDSFQFEAFKELANDIDQSDVQDIEKVLGLLKEWKHIESREMYKIAQVRLEAIKKFQEHIKADSKEVPTMHNFLKEFPWILDPRMMEFKDEVTYSDLLKTKFEEVELDEKDRRIDFLCLKFGQGKFIVELKRPSKTINAMDLEQGMAYVSFLEARILNEHQGGKVFCYVIGNKLSDNPLAIKKAKSYRDSNDVYFKSYHDLLQDALSYHKEFIDKYDEFQ